jgi:DNA-binding MarR family transcriptional regulator
LVGNAKSSSSGKKSAQGTLEGDLRVLQVLFPHVMAAFKRTAIPDEVRGIFADPALGPRHLMPVAHLIYEGPMTVNELARRLDLAPATTSLMVGELSRSGVIERREDEADRRRTIVSISGGHRGALERWLSGGEPMRRTVEQLSAAERRAFLKALRILETELRRQQTGPATALPGT